MKVKIIHSKEEFEPIRSILNEVTSGLCVQHEIISIVVKDAQLIASNDYHRFEADRRVYTYSSTLSRWSNKKRLARMNPSQLSMDDFVELRKFFEAL